GAGGAAGVRGGGRGGGRVDRGGAPDPGARALRRRPVAVAGWLRGPHAAPSPLRRGRPALHPAARSGGSSGVSRTQVKEVRTRPLSDMAAGRLAGVGAKYHPSLPAPPARG